MIFISFSCDGVCSRINLLNDFFDDFKGGSVKVIYQCLCKLMSKGFLQVLLRKVYDNSEPPRQAGPREFKRPKRANIVQFSCYFLSSDHDGISTVDALPTPTPRLGWSEILVLIVLKKGWVVKRERLHTNF